MKSVNERFESCVERIPEAGCWIWTGGVDKDGYGQLSIGGKGIRTHRYSYAATFGQIPDGMFVCHRCDVPACVNPNHLFLGTPLDNTRDRDMKGRRVLARPMKGERNGMAKLTEKDVIAIREDPRLLRVIAADYGVTRYQISNVKKGKSWACLPPSYQDASHGK